MAGSIEIEARVKALEDAVFGAVEIPDFMVNINSTVDKTGLYCYGIKAGINSGAMFIGWRSTVANPTNNSHFDEKGYAK